MHHSCINWTLFTNVRQADICSLHHQVSGNVTPNTAGCPFFPKQNLWEVKPNRPTAVEILMLENKYNFFYRNHSFIQHTWSRWRASHCWAPGGTAHRKFSAYKPRKWANFPLLEQQQHHVSKNVRWESRSVLKSWCRHTTLRRWVWPEPDCKLWEKSAALLRSGLTWAVQRPLEVSKTVPVLNHSARLSVESLVLPSLHLSVVLLEGLRGWSRLIYSFIDHAGWSS